MRTLAVTQNITLDGSIEMLGDWFDPQAGADDTDLVPEDGFVASAASCLAVSIVAMAERQDFPPHALEVSAEGVLGRREDGRFGFTAVEQTVDLRTDAEHEESARTLVGQAEESCFVSVSLDLPLATTVRVSTSAVTT
jgi:organic hydroperoxide reductase OsmC/OhrA